MKKKELIKQIIRTFHLAKKFDVIPRDIEIPLNTNKIITLIGARRSGKTYVLYSIINKLQDNIPKEQIVYINFEDERLDLKIDELDLILQSYKELYPDLNLNNCYLFFDEIQNIEGWEKFVRRIYDSVTKNIFITGSNSKLLSSEIASSLRGRTLTFTIYPLSFKEYLRFKNIVIDLYGFNEVSKIKSEFLTYLQDGGFPELIFLDKRYHTDILQEYFNVMIYKDLIERYKISNITALKFFLKRVIASSTKEISINKIYNELKSNGIKIGKNSLYDYLEYIQAIFLVQVLYKYSNRINELGEKKVYAIDTGLVNAIEFSFSKNMGKALENLVFLELKRRKEEIYYHTSTNSECDFILTTQNNLPMQVSWDISEETTKIRELKGLLNACKTFKQNKGLIITADLEDSFEINGIKIEVIPFFKWCLVK